MKRGKSSFGKAFLSKKRFALVEIAIVLFSVFLVALPTIAAEQNHKMQKISASEITTTSEDDYVLDIYGNANEDDTIDMRDLTYVKLIFFGKKPETELADAKYDGKINPLDFIQIKLIIVGKEKELTMIDTADRIVTVKKPIKRIVVTFRQCLEVIRSVKVEKDRIVGVESLAQSSGEPPYGTNYKIFFPEFSDLPSVGIIWNPDVEAIMNLHPDVVFLMMPYLKMGTKIDKAQEVLESAGITVLRFYGCTCGGKALQEETIKFGYILDKKREAEKFLDFHEECMNSVKEKVKEIPEDDKPKVYFESTKPYSSYRYSHISLTGGKDIFEDTSGSVDPEAVVVRDPDIIIKHINKGSGYHVDADDMTEIEKVREEIMSRPELQNVKAVKNGRVYVISGYITCAGSTAGCRCFLQVLYQAKWFHPELFGELDPKAIHQEYLTRFQGLDIDLDEKGVFVYPEPS